MQIKATQIVTDPDNLNASVYADLRVKLITGVLKPAETVSIRKLAESYGVSAMPVREALRQLASEGALISAARKAYRVPDLSAKEASNLFFVRGVLEGAAAELAAQNITDKTLSRLEKFVSRTHKYLEARNATKFLLANYEFHSTIYQCSDNNVLVQSIDRLYVQTGPWLAHAIENLVDVDNWLGEHGEIINTLRAGDAVATRKLIEEDAFWGVDLYRYRS